MNKTNSVKVQKLVQAAMLVALSVLLMVVVRFPLFASAPFLEYDMADVPVLIASVILGPSYGIVVLLITCIIQAFTVSAAASYYGLIMHFVASGALVLIAGITFKKIHNTKGLILGLVLGAVAMTVLMIPLNIFITPLYMGVPREAVIGLLIPAIIPFNAAKAGINAVITAVLYFPLSKALEKANLINKQ